MGALLSDGLAFSQRLMDKFNQLIKDQPEEIEYEEEEFIKDNKIFWTETETKTCHVCLSTQHLAAACPKIQDRRRNANRINKLTDLYKRKKVEADNINTF